MAQGFRRPVIHSKNLFIQRIYSFNKNEKCSFKTIPNYSFKENIQQSEKPRANVAPLHTISFTSGGDPFLEEYNSKTQDRKLTQYNSTTLSDLQLTQLMQLHANHTNLST